jgi:hypothetical protein
MDMAKENLKPCPFCGGKAMLRKTTNNNGIFYAVGCINETAKNNHIMSSDLWHIRLEEAIDDWNTRPHEAALESRIKELEAETSWLKHDENVVAFADYMNNCCPVRQHQREGGETIPEEEIKCSFEDCIYGHEIVHGFCTADNSDPRSEQCPVHTPICPFCNGSGHFENADALQIVKGDVGEYVVMLRTILKAALTNRNKLIEELAQARADIKKAAPGEKTELTIDEWIQRAIEAEDNYDKWKDDCLEARRNVVKWVMYDGTPETLPENDRWIVYKKDTDIENYVCILALTNYCQAVFYAGQQWAYLPTPEVQNAD